MIRSYVIVLLTPLYPNLSNPIIRICICAFQLLHQLSIIVPKIDFNVRTLKQGSLRLLHVFQLSIF